MTIKGFRVEIEGNEKMSYLVDKVIKDKFPKGTKIAGRGLGIEEKLINDELEAAAFILRWDEKINFYKYVRKERIYGLVKEDNLKWVGPYEFIRENKNFLEVKLIDDLEVTGDGFGPFRFTLKNIKESVFEHHKEINLFYRVLDDWWETHSSILKSTDWVYNMHKYKKQSPFRPGMKR